MGEIVDFDFVLTDWMNRFVSPAGRADYAVLILGTDRIETEPDHAGHFRFAATLDGVRDGDRIVASAAAFRQRGGRDFMQVQGEWLQSNSPYELADERVARDEIRLDVYQSVVELRLAQPPQAFDPESGVLRIRREDGRAVAVYVDRPGRPGFRITGPGADGCFTVTYRPAGTQLSPVGTTRVDFTIHDLGGQRHKASIVLDTP